MSIQTKLFDATIIPKLCAAMNRYISAQPSRGRWISGTGWIDFPNLPPFIPAKQLHMNESDLSLLRAFFEIDSNITDLVFWNCTVVATKTFHPFFSAG